MRACRRVSFNKIPPAFFFCQLLLLKPVSASIQDDDYDEWWWRTVMNNHRTRRCRWRRTWQLQRRLCLTPFLSTSISMTFVDVISFQGLQLQLRRNPNRREWAALQIKCKRIFSLFLLYVKQALHIPSAYFFLLLIPFAPTFKCYTWKHISHTKGPGKFCGMKSLGVRPRVPLGARPAGVYLCVLCTRAVWC